MIIHADEVLNGSGQGKKKARVESFVVGHDLANGERLQWIVEGGKFKASFLLPDNHHYDQGNPKSEGLLISEVGFVLSSLNIYIYIHYDTDLPVPDCCPGLRIL